MSGFCQTDMATSVSETYRNAELMYLPIPARTYRRSGVKVQPLGPDQKDGFVLSSKLAEKAVHLTEMLSSLPTERQSAELYARREKFVEAARNLKDASTRHQIYGTPLSFTKSHLEELAVQAVGLPGLKPAQVNEVLRRIAQQDQTIVRPIQRAA